MNLISLCLRAALFIILGFCLLCLSESERVKEELSQMSKVIKDEMSMQSNMIKLEMSEMSNRIGVDLSESSDQIKNELSLLSNIHNDRKLLVSSPKRMKHEDAMKEEETSNDSTHSSPSPTKLPTSQPTFQRPAQQPTFDDYAGGHHVSQIIQAQFPTGPVGVRRVFYEYDKLNGTQLILQWYGNRQLYEDKILLQTSSLCRLYLPTTFFYR